MEHFPPERDVHASLKALLVALDASETALRQQRTQRRRDETKEAAKEAAT